MRAVLFAASVALGLLGCRAAAATEVDLVAEFDRARVGVEPTRVDIGTPAARPLLVSGWSHDEGAGASTFAWATGDRSVIEFYLAHPRELAVAFGCMPFQFPGAPEQRVAFVLNGTAGPEVVLRPGNAEYDVRLPASAARAGWNRLTLRYAYARRPSDVLGSPDPRRLAVGWDFIRFGPPAAEPRPGPSVDRGASTLTIPGGAWLGYSLPLAAGAALRLGDVTFADDGDATLEIAVETDAAPRAIVARIDRAHPTRRVPLPAARLARVSLALRGDASASVRVTRPTIDAVVAGDPPVVDVGAPRGRPNFLVYLVDTLRADRLGCYGHARPTSPRLDAFAREGIRFTDVVAEAPWTRASIASLFTGLPARRHGVDGRTDALPDEAVTMAERFAQAGYETAGFTTNGNVASVYGFDQGFAVYELMAGAPIPGADGIVRVPLPSSDAVTRRALGWLDARAAGRPFFLFLHTADPHAPYAPPAVLRARLGAPAGPPDVGSLAMMHALHDGSRVADARLVRELLALYDAEVAQNDEEFGRVLEGLRRRGIYDDTVVVFVADHGEEFHEHGGWEHGHTLYRELLRIPLVVKLPGGDGAGLRVDRTVQLGDVLPTLLGRAGIEPSPALPGRDVFALASGPPSPAVSLLALDGRAADSVIAGGWHLVRTEERWQLFDRDADPAERHDVVAAHPVTADHLADLLEQANAAATPVLPRRTAIVTDAVRENLKALGYVR